jgi:predicted GH43/DUF377 family glycosyl hydrolase/ubiquinone/menaquinone biosynthesis C-methylase UbiE
VNWYGRYIQKYIEPNDEVLELACGVMMDTMDTYEPGQLICKRLDGTDIFQPYLDLLEKRGIKTFNCDLTKLLPFENNSYDVVLMTDIINLMPSREIVEQLISEAKRVARKKVIVLSLHKASKRDYHSTVFTYPKFNLPENKYQLQQYIVPKEVLLNSGFNIKTIPSISKIIKSNILELFGSDAFRKRYHFGICDIQCNDKWNISVVLESEEEWEKECVHAFAFCVDENKDRYIDASGRMFVYYTGTNNGINRIGLAFTKDRGKTFEKYVGNPILQANSESKWFKYMVDSAIVIHNDKGFTMFCSGMNTKKESGGMGLFTSQDGINFIEQSGNPVLIPMMFKFSDNTPLQYFGKFNLLKLSTGTWFLTLEGASWTGQANAFRIWGATSEDMVTWTPINNGYPILSSTVGFESIGVADPHVYEHDKKLLMMYNGIGKDCHWRITLAEASISDFNFVRLTGNPILSPKMPYDLHTVATFLVKPNNGILKEFYFEGFANKNSAKIYRVERT